jgi:hypothetical protein
MNPEDRFHPGVSSFICTSGTDPFLGIHEGKKLGHHIFPIPKALINASTNPLSNWVPQHL